MSAHEAGHSRGGVAHGIDSRGGIKDNTPDTPDGSPGEGARLPHRGRGLLRKGGLVLALLALVAFGVLLHRVADAVRGTPIESVIGAEGLPAPSDPAFSDLAGRLADVSFSTGHDVEILIDDTVFQGILDDIDAAARSVTLFDYFCSPGALADRFTDALVRAARRGVRVLALGDGFACGSWLDALRAPLEAAGGRVAVFRPIRWYSLHRAQHRNHGRAVVVDGTIGYTGGFGIDDRWVDDAGRGPWRETGARFTGPAVASLQGAFLSSWAEATGSLLLGEDLLPAGGSVASGAWGDSAGVGTPGGVNGPGSPGEVVSPKGLTAGLLVSRPGLGSSPAQRYLALTLAGARETIWITNAYFVPSRSMRALLLEAAARGVDVRILVPGRILDRPSTRWAGQLYFEELLEGGVRIFHYQGRMLHAKTLVVDGVWSNVGSLNLDRRSLRLNEEWALLVQDEGTGARLDSLFLQDLENARELTLAEHRRRPFLDRLRERMISVLVPLL